MTLAARPEENADRAPFNSEAVPQWLRAMASAVRDESDVSAEISADHRIVAEHEKDFQSESRRIIEHDDLSTPPALDKAVAWFSASAAEFLDVAGTLDKLYDTYRHAQWAVPPGASCNLLTLSAHFAPTVFQRAVLAATDQLGLVLANDDRRTSAGASPSLYFSPTSIVGGTCRFLSTIAQSGEVGPLALSLDALLKVAKELCATRSQVGMAALLGEGYAHADEPSRSRVVACIDSAFARASTPEGDVALTRFNVEFMAHVLDFHEKPESFQARLLNHNVDRLAANVALRHFPAETTAELCRRASSARESESRLIALNLVAPLGTPEALNACIAATFHADPATAGTAFHKLAGHPLLSLAAPWLANTLDAALASPDNPLFAVVALVDRFGPPDERCSELWDSTFRRHPITAALAQRLAEACRTSLGYFEQNRYPLEEGFQRFVHAVGLRRLLLWVRDSDPALRESAHTLLECLRRPQFAAFLTGEIQKILKPT